MVITIKKIIACLILSFLLGLAACGPSPSQPKQEKGKKVEDVKKHERPPIDILKESVIFADTPKLETIVKKYGYFDEVKWEDAKDPQYNATVTGRVSLHRIESFCEQKGKDNLMQYRKAASSVKSISVVLKFSVSQDNSTPYLYDSSVETKLRGGENSKYSLKFDIRRLYENKSSIAFCKAILWNGTPQSGTGGTRNEHSLKNDSAEKTMKNWAQTDAYSAYRAISGLYLGQKGKTVNDDGFISTPPIKMQKPARTIRIVFLGESSTAGTGHDLADRETWPWRVWELLKNKFPGRKVEFINGALGGYTSFESFGRLWSRIRFYSPDIIVVYHGWNEFYYFDQVDRMNRWRVLADGSWGVERIDKFNPASAVPSGLRKPTYDKRAVEVWRTNLKLILEASKIFEAELYVCKQATLIAAKTPKEDRARCQPEAHGFDYNAHIDAYRQLYRVIDQEIDAGHVIDTSVLSGNPAYFYDHVHPTKEGAERIAEIVAAKVLKTYGKKPAAAQAVRE